jgi:hypothetical protein
MKIHLQKILHMKFNPFGIFLKLDLPKMAWKMESREFKV